MTMLAPAPIRAIFDAAKKDYPGADLLGILPNEAHLASGGYHVPRRYLEAHRSWDYSIQHAADRLGGIDNACGIDIGFDGYGGSHLKLVSQRLLAAGKARDPRMNAIREFYGCGPSSRSTDVIGWDFQAHTTATTSDYSHRGHIHLSVIREYADNAAALAHIHDVIAGRPLVQPKPIPSIPNTQVALWPWPVTNENDCLGNIANPSSRVHGGTVGDGAKVRACILAVKHALHAKGYSGFTLSNGIWGPGTDNAIVKWRTDHGYKSPTPKLLGRAGYHLLVGA